MVMKHFIETFHRDLLFRQHIGLVVQLGIFFLAKEGWNWIGIIGLKYVKVQTASGIVSRM